MQGTWTGPDETFARLKRARRSPLFDDVPSISALVCRFVEEGLDRLEAAEKSAPRPDEGVPK